MTEKILIPAIHDDDLEKLLARHHMLEQLKNGELKCFLCNEAMAWDNIYGLVLKDERPKFICDNLDCLDKILN